MEPAYDPFFNVRRGGPKEKRIRRVELMGEHKPRPVYYIKVSQPVGIEDDYISDDVLREVFSSIGDLGDLYRPMGNVGERKEFAFVGFYDKNHVQFAVKTKGNFVIGSTNVTVEEAKSWLLELYPKK